MKGLNTGHVWVKFTKGQILSLLPPSVLEKEPEGPSATLPSSAALTVGMIFVLIYVCM